MRVLYLSQLLPYPLDAGAKVRSYYTLRHLTQNHEVVLISFVRESDSMEAVAHLQSICAEVRTVPMRRGKFLEAFHLVRALATDQPFLMCRDWRREMTSEIRETIAGGQTFDAIHADQLSMAPFALFAHALAGKSETKLVLDQHNAMYRIPARLAKSEKGLFRRILLKREARKMAEYEIGTCAKFDRVVFVADEDLAALRSKGLAMHSSRDRVIPISIDTSHKVTRDTSKGRFRITFMGGLHWPPNEEGVKWFEYSIWPKIAEAAPHAVFTVIGKPAASGRDRGSAGRVERLGFVEDPTPLLDETAVFVVPLLSGGGMRVKILDAWAAGLPVISTSVGAEGIHAEHGANLFLADDPAAFASCVLQVIEDSTVADHIATGGAATLDTHYNWRRTYEKWNEVYA